MQSREIGGIFEYFRENPPREDPTYNTIAQRKLIFDVLQEEWDEPSLSFVPYGHGSMRTTTAVRPSTLNSK